MRLPVLGRRIQLGGSRERRIGDTRQHQDTQTLKLWNVSEFGGDRGTTGAIVADIGRKEGTTRRLSVRPCEMAGCRSAHCCRAVASADLLGLSSGGWRARRASADQCRLPQGQPKGRNFRCCPVFERALSSIGIPPDSRAETAFETSQTCVAVPRVSPEQLIDKYSGSRGRKARLLETA